MQLSVNKARLNYKWKEMKNSQIEKKWMTKIFTKNFFKGPIVCILVFKLMGFPIG